MEFAIKREIEHQVRERVMTLRKVWFFFTFCSDWRNNHIFMVIMEYEKLMTGEWWGLIASVSKQGSGFS